jgi:hypothetical protein
MVSSGVLRRLALVRTDVSEEPGASFIRVTKIGELGTTQAATWRNNPEDTILHSHRRENLKSYTVQIYLLKLLFKNCINLKAGILVSYATSSAA